MAFSFRNLVLGIEKPVVAGELLSAGNGTAEPEEAAGRPATAWFPPAGSEPLDARSRAENRRYLFGRDISLRVPGKIYKLARSPTRFPQFTFPDFESVFHVGLFPHTFSSIYRNTTDFVLLIKCSF